MTVYTKSMMEALTEVRGLQEDNMDLMRKAAKGAMQTIKFKDGKLKMDSFTASGIMGVYDKVNPKNKKQIETIINSGTKAQIMKLQDLAMKAVKSENDPEIAEEVELDEALPSHLKKHFDKDGNPKSKEGQAAWERIATSKGFKKYTPQQIKMAIGVAFDKRYVQGNMTGATKTIEKIAKGLSEIEPVRDALRRANEEAELDEAKYELYHKDFSSAMQHAYKMAKKLHGITIDPKEIDSKVATGPRKPSSGKTNKYRLKGDKGNVQIQVYNMDNKKYELNMYKEEVELEESKMKELHGYIEDGKKADWIAKKMKLDVKTIKALVGQDASGRYISGNYNNEAYEVGTDEYRKYTQDITPGEVDEASARADAMRGMRRGKEVDPADVDTDASDADVKAASKNILAQMRKASNLGGRFEVEFLDKKKEKIKPAVANAFIKKYEGMRRPADKEKFQNQAMKSYKDLLKVLKAGYNEEVSEGTWKMPKSINQIAPLMKLMKKPIKLGKEGDDAINVVEPYIGDDELYDDLYVAGKKNPNGDARPMIKDALRRFGFKEEVKETILDRIDRKLKERKNG